MTRLTIDELAERSGVSERNIRYYQTRGLLPAPTVSGRLGYYDDRHVDRLALIQELRAEGLNLQAIGWLLGGAGGVDSDELRRLKRAVLDGWAVERPEDRPIAEVLRGFPDPRVDPTPDGASTSDGAPTLDGARTPVERALELGLLGPADDPAEVRVRLPAVLAAGRELTAMGASVDRLLDVLAVMREHAHAVAVAYLDVFDETVLADWDVRGRPDHEWPAVREAVDRIRPLAGEALLAVFSQVMAEVVASHLAEGTEEAGEAAP